MFAFGFKLWLYTRIYIVIIQMVQSVTMPDKISQQANTPRTLS